MTVFNTDSALAQPTTAPLPRRHASWRTWSLHLAEMMIAMVAGMVGLGGALEGLLSLAGASLSAASASVMASAMAFNMTAPMVWWMRHRGHARRHNVEMAGSMIVPTAIVIALHWLGIVAGDSVLLIQHVVMIPAMVGVMLTRFEHYAH